MSGVRAKELQSASAKPFVKWVGGKTQLLPEIDAAIAQYVSGKESVTYVEPFIGGGAVLFHVLQKFPQIKMAVINDINPNLINVYSVIKAEPERLISALSELQERNDEAGEDARQELFYQMRESYNQGIESDVLRAAAFIFLNRTCFNGLYRVNSKGAFNVPFGRYAHPRICDPDTIWADSDLLQNVTIKCGDFASTGEFASPDTVYYLDPPYKPLSQTSSFNSYAKEAFDDAEQVRLSEFCKKLHGKGACWVLSNSDLKGKDPTDDFFDVLYAQFNISQVWASRMVNANPEKRGKLTELLITNW